MIGLATGPGYLRSLTSFKRSLTIEPRVTPMDLQNLNTTTITPHEKAVQINLDKRFYGTFAEIGAGQEVARWFFRVGAAAGTVAKSISAYDMAVSDAIYGDA